MLLRIEEAQLAPEVLKIADDWRKAVSDECDQFKMDRLAERVSENWTGFDAFLAFSDQKSEEECLCLSQKMALFILLFLETFVEKILTELCRQV